MNLALTSLLAAGTIAGAGLAAGAVGPVAPTPIVAAAAAQENPDRTDVSEDPARPDGPCARPGERVPDEVRGALGVVGQALDSLVAEGTLTEAQDQAVRDRVGETLRDRVAQRCRGEVRERVVEGILQRVRRGAPAVAAEAIGIPTEELVAALRSGASLAEIAADEGVDRATVVDALVAAGNEALDEAAQNPRVPEQAITALRERLPELAERIVDHRPGSRDRATDAG